MQKNKLTYDNIVATLTKVCQKQNIVLVLNDPTIGEDNGLSYGKTEIHLGNKYKSNLIMLAIAMHEYGHVMLSRRRGKKYKKMPIFREEVLAWAIGIESQIKYFGKSFSKSQGNFMIDCLKTYSKDHYNFYKEYPKDDDDEDDDN